MAFEKIKEADLADKGIVGLPDVPGLSTTEMQAKFDELSRDVIIPKINDIVEKLNGTEVGQSSKVLNPISEAEECIQSALNAVAEIAKENKQDKHNHDNKVTLDKVSEELLLNISKLLLLLEGISGIVDSVRDDNTEIPTSAAIVDYVKKLGAGDMLQEVYDKDGDGVVDNAANAKNAENATEAGNAKELGGVAAEGYMLAAKVITAYADMMANMVAGYTPDALAVKEGFEQVNNKLTASDGTAFRFGYNADTGEYGYIVTGEDGADTVVPFSNAKKLYEALQYSGLVTEDMTFDEMCAVLAEVYPAWASMLNSQWVVFQTGDASATYTATSNEEKAYFKINSSQNSGGFVVGYVSPFFDLTDKSVLSLKGHIHRTQVGTSYDASIYLTKQATYDHANDMYLFRLNDSTSTDKVCDGEFDVSGLTGNYRLGMKFPCGSNINTGAYTQITEAKLR